MLSRKSLNLLRRMSVKEKEELLGMEKERFYWRLVAKGFSQVDIINYNDIISPSKTLLDKDFSVKYKLI